jgi:hypothetical protein
LNKRFTASYKIAIGFAALALLAVYGYRYANDYLLGREHFPRLVPGSVNVLGVDTSKGYRIIVQNQTAKLVYGNADKFGPGEMDPGGGGGDVQKKFIPIKELLKGMQGDIGGLSYFVRRLNDIDDDSLPPDAKVWKYEDIEKALNGDASIRAKLVADLNVKLDGTPLDRVSKAALYNGIIVDTPVPMKVQFGEEKKTLVARVHQPYMPTFLSQVQNRLKDKFADNQIIATEYAVAADQVANGVISKEDVAKSLRAFGVRAKKMNEFPQQILDSITPALNENQIVEARYTSEDTSKGKRYVLILKVSEEGRKRIWQFTRGRVHSQLLVTVNGVAIAAPVVAHAISDDEITVRGLEDEWLIQEAVATINQTKRTSNSK